MLKLKKLTFSNIGRFIEEQVIDLTKLSSLIQVDANNNNTGGSSGSGKSTVFNALDFLLGLSDLSISVLQSRLTKSHISVSGEFEWDGKNVTITRARKLSVVVDGVETTGSSKLAEEELDKILGMPRNLFRILLHKRQGEQGFFLQMTPSKMNDFLTDTLDLSAIRSKIDLIDSKAKDTSDTIAVITNSLNALKSGLEATENAIKYLGNEPTTDVTEELISTLRIQYEYDRDNHILVSMGHKRELDDLEKTRPQVTTTPFNRDQIENLEKEIGTILVDISNLEKNEIERQSQVKAKISELQIAISNLNNQEKQRQNEIERTISDIKFNKTYVLQDVAIGKRSMEEAVVLAENLKKIRLSLCPTCEQSWITDQAKIEETKILDKIKSCKNSVIAGKEAEKRLDLYEQELNRYRIDLEPRINPEIQILNEKIDQYRIDLRPQIISEVLELKLKIDYKNKELYTCRLQEKEHQFKENLKIKDALSVFTQNQDELHKKHQSIIQELQSAENKTFNNLHDVEIALKNFRESKKSFEESYNKFNNQKSEYEEQIVVKSLELSYLQEQLDLFAESKRAIKSYLSCSFDDALDSISETATHILKTIPTMANSSISLEGTKEMNSGAIKEQVNAVLASDGELEVPIKSLSGGERSAVDLAIDLAVTNLIQEKANKGIDIMILDEPFNGFDSIGIEQALEMLRTFSIDKKILLVEHDSVAKEFIQDKVTIVREGETSYIKSS